MPTRVGSSRSCSQALDPGRRSHPGATLAGAAAGEAGDDDVEDGDDAVDDGVEDAADGVDNGHEAVADGLEEGFHLRWESRLVRCRQR